MDPYVLPCHLRYDSTQMDVRPYLHPSQFVYGRYLKKLSNKTQEALGEMSQAAQESLSALRTVHAFNARKWEEQRFGEKVANILDLGKKEAWASGIFYGQLMILPPFLIGKTLFTPHPNL